MTTIFRFEDCELDLDVFEIRRGGEAVKVEPQVFDVLVYLVKHRDRVVPKRELLDEIWDDRFVSESALTSRLKAARRAVGDDGRAQRVIRTVHGRGYRFVADVLTPAEEPDQAGSTDTTGAAEPPPPPSSAPLQPETRYAENGGYSTAYQVAGDGDDDIVFIPGFVSNIDLQWELPGFSRFFERLASFSRLIVFDKRGTGLSDRIPPNETPTLEERVDDAIAVMDAVGAQNATVFGISEGGAMAVMLAAMVPDRVRRLVLCNSYGRVDWLPSEVIEPGLAQLREGWGQGTWYADVLAPSWGKHESMRKLLARYERHSATPAVVERFLRLNVQIDVGGVLDSITQPTLVLHRSGDQMVPISAGEWLADGIPGAKMVELEGSDHLAFAGDVDALLDEVEAFVKDDRREQAPPERVLASVVVATVGDSESEGVKLPGDSRARMVDRLRAKANGVADRHRGHIAQHAEDDCAIVLVLNGPARAVQAAFDLHESLRAENTAALHTGVHTAQVELHEDKIGGAGVSIGLAVSNLSTPGEVWTSRTVCDLVAGSGLVFEARGSHDLPGTDEAWKLYAATLPT